MDGLRILAALSLLCAAVAVTSLPLDVAYRRWAKKPLERWIWKPCGGKGDPPPDVRD
jgi:hypothetical protein